MFRDDPKIARRESSSSDGLQLTLFAAADHPLIEKIRTTDLNTMTPFDALATIKAWQDELAADKKPAPR